MTLAEKLFPMKHPLKDAAYLLNWRGMKLRGSYGIPGLWEITARIAGGRVSAHFYGSTPKIVAERTEAFFDAIGKTS